MTNDRNIKLKQRKCTWYDDAFTTNRFGNANVSIATELARSGDPVQPNWKWGLQNKKNLRMTI